MYTYYICLYHHIPLLLMSKPHFYMSMAYNMTHFELTAYKCMWFVSDCFMDVLYLAVKQIFITNLVIYDAHIVHYHMDWLQSVALGQSYFCTSGLSGQLLLDLGHFAVSNQYYCSGETNIWRYYWLFGWVVGYIPNVTPCFCIVIIFIASFLMSQLHIFFLTHHFRVILLSIDSMYISTARWLSFCYCSSAMASLGGLQLICPDLVQIIFGLPSGSLCNMCTFLFLPDSPLWALLGYLPLLHPAVVLCWVLSLLLSVL